MLTIETSIIISTLIGSVTVCIVKILHETHKSKCSEIQMCCINCKRNVGEEEEDKEEIDKEEIEKDKSFNDPIDIIDLELALSKH